eukprot:TRINITY_DN6256_c0_g1_i5.p2 TRINITY_DN6256_c0_g1~~TRINITY_DN6256_c0_g1_i5.p2  ORF type:complete len:125 (-),score=13.27 TRINITY_DN6256_c0_g1_i5:172-546(-)
MRISCFSRRFCLLRVVPSYLLFGFIHAFAMASSRAGAQEGMESTSDRVEVEHHGNFSPRSDFDSGSATPTSSFDDPLETRSPADDFWLREDGADDTQIIWEKFTFVHVASAQPTASRRSRSSPC